MNWCTGSGTCATIMIIVNNIMIAVMMPMILMHEED